MQPKRKSNKKQAALTQYYIKKQTNTKISSANNQDPLKAL